MTNKEIYIKAKQILNNEKSIDIDEHFKTINTYVVKSQIFGYLSYLDRIIDIFKDMINDINEGGNNLEIARLRRNLLHTALYGTEEQGGFLHGLGILFNKREFEKGLDKNLVADFFIICVNLKTNEVHPTDVDSSSLDWDENSKKLAEFNHIVNEIKSTIQKNI